jgi:arsenate reductase (thioredoxin)
MLPSFRTNALVCTAVVLYLSLTTATAGAADVAAEASVTMVCEHGSVKSLIAASLFNQAAKMRGLPFHAVSRAITPDAGVPPKIVEALQRDGVDVADFHPRKISGQELAASPYVVAIGVDLPRGQSDTAKVLQWNDIPPASIDYNAARAALLAHVNALLDQLEKSR